MKKKITAIMILALLSAPLNLYADGPIVKLGRGLTNIVTSPIEYLAQTSMMADEHNAGIALVAGFVRGTFYTVARIVGGAIETVTFLVPLPSNGKAWPENYAPLMDPPTGLEVLAEQQGRRGYLES